MGISVHDFLLSSKSFILFFEFLDINMLSFMSYMPYFYCSTILLFLFINL